MFSTKPVTKLTFQVPSEMEEGGLGIARPPFIRKLEENYAVSKPPSVKGEHARQPLGKCQPDGGSLPGGFGYFSCGCDKTARPRHLKG